MVVCCARAAEQEEHVSRVCAVQGFRIPVLDSNLGQWFSKDSPSQSSSLDSLASYYCAKLGPPERLTPVKAATSARKPTICAVKSSKVTREDPPPLSGDSDALSRTSGVPSATSDPDLRLHTELSTSTPLKSAPVWNKLERRQGPGGTHSRSHSLASPPSSSALRRRQTTRRHAIYGGTGLPGIPVPYDDPEETKVNPARATFASFDSTKAVCAISENSFSESESPSPRKMVDYLTAKLASESPTKSLLTTPLRTHHFHDSSEDDSDTPGYEMSITAVSYDELDLLSPVKRLSSVSPLKLRTGDKRKIVEQAPTQAARSAMNPKTKGGPSKPDVFEHLPMMRELLDLVDEATKSWDAPEDM
ncbi:uncharacterized protein B0H18DRAFT_999539 [Fomitopsis serialis]|uniref:uncharacterized protein n=1 Tax=Fomitopsis serialis TaxID=139415 RepID=UPI00200870ED|nr:uncharacterized protein B0H18DRAFT_999539 [Neoantrodia serialis]KAH9928950.1 hypothetical protein B0H18DRAFT_999539 [Neoantrodia serialis]